MPVPIQQLVSTPTLADVAQQMRQSAPRLPEPFGFAPFIGGPYEPSRPVEQERLATWDRVLP